MEVRRPKHLVRVFRVVNKVGEVIFVVKGRTLREVDPSLSLNIFVGKNRSVFSFRFSL